MTYGKRLKEALALAGVSRQKLADDMGLSVQAVGMVITGKTVAMTAENNSRAAQLLAVSADWLATGDGPMVNQGVWPFVHISPDQYLKLNTEQRTNIENYARGLLNLPALSPTSDDTDTTGFNEALVFKHSLPKGKTPIDKRIPVDEISRQKRRS